MRGSSEYHSAVARWSGDDRGSSSERQPSVASSPSESVMVMVMLSSMSLASMGLHASQPRDCAAVSPAMGRYRTMIPKKAIKQNV